MATILFDGTSSQTAAKATDTVIFAANPALFTGASELNGNVVLTFGSNTLTVTGTTLSANGLSNVTPIAGSNLVYATSANATPAGAGNTLAFLLGGSTLTTLGGSSTDTSVSAAFGGLGRADSLDNAESIAIAASSKGSYLIYGNAGNDTITAGALESNTATTVFGGRGADSINVAAQTATNANFAIYGGEDGDAITISRTSGTGSLTIFGGTAAADSADGNDSIALGTANVGTINVYAAGGNDIVTSDGTSGGAAATFANNSTVNIFGGSGDDVVTIGVSAGKSTFTVTGGAGADAITVANGATGSTTIYGGTGPADSLDGNDTINISGGGSFGVFGNSGADIITASNLTASDGSSVTAVTIFGGRGEDNITANVTGTVKANLAIYGSENSVDNADSITTANAIDGSTIIYGGTAAADAADGKDSITVTGNGVTTIYAAGGDDTVNIAGANSSASSTNAITVFGGAGADSVAIGNKVAANGTVTIDGGAGVDTFSFTSKAGTVSIGSAVTINNFGGGAAGDKLIIDNGTVGNTILTADGSAAQTLQQALDLAAANATAYQVSAVVFQGNAYVVVNNNGSTGFDATADTAIKLTGVSTLADVTAAVSVIG